MCFCQRAGHARISIHALREEGDGYGNVLSISRSGFQSTPSARRATVRSVGGPTRGIISIHALREEGDDFFGVDALFFFAFQSTPSARRATQHYSVKVQPHLISIHALREEGDRGRDCPPCQRSISIHALREEGDWKCLRRGLPWSNFNPRPPRGGRPTPSA